LSATQVSERFLADADMVELKGSMRCTCRARMSLWKRC